MQKIKSSPELDSIVANLYISGLDTYQVAEKCECSQTFIMNSLKRQNIKRRATQVYTRKYIPNENFFDIIDTEEKAYILGFLYADGNNYVNERHSYEVSIALIEEDKIILEKFRELLSPNVPLKFVQNKDCKNQYLLKINNKKLTRQLTKLGCMPAKSLTLQFPNWLIDSKLRQHFIRGYFDGDGSLYSKRPSKTGHIDYGWQITSTEQFCRIIKNLFKDKLSIHCSIRLSCPKTNKITTTISIGGNLRVRKVLDWLYQGATIYLPRKYEKYQEFIRK